MIAWVFPGQGSQFAGMGAGLAGGPAGEVFATAHAVLGWDVRSMSEQALAETEVSQPAILTVSVAAAESLRAAGFAPDAVAGHSVGEFAALVAGSAITFEDGLRAVSARADAMAAAGREQPGGMAAILGLALGDVLRAIEIAPGAVGIASINSPGQIVISGRRDAVAAVADAARRAGARRVIPLAVSVAAHSSLMAPAAQALRRALAGIRIRPPQVPFVSCVDGRAHDDPATIAGLLCDALVRPVRWMDTVRALHDLGTGRFFEVGPGRVLSGLVASILPRARVTAVADDGAVAGLDSELAGGRVR